MQVPVLLIRQVLVKDSSAPIMLLSGMVTSLTNDALLVQPGSFSGLGMEGVEGISGVAVIGSSASVTPVTGISMVGASSVTAAGL